MEMMTGDDDDDDDEDDDDEEEQCIMCRLASKNSSGLLAMKFGLNILC